MTFGTFDVQTPAMTHGAVIPRDRLPAAPAQGTAPRSPLCDADWLTDAARMVFEKKTWYAPDSDAAARV